MFVIILVSKHDVGLIETLDMLLRTHMDELQFSHAQYCFTAEIGHNDVELVKSQLSGLRWRVPHELQFLYKKEDQAGFTVWNLPSTWSFSRVSPPHSSPYHLQTDD